MQPIKVEGYTFERVHYPKWSELTVPIYLHQAAVLDSYEQGKNILVCTKTGSGKTAAALFPLIKNQHSAIFVYPTNALIKDQLSNIHRTLTNILKRRVHVEKYAFLDVELDSVPVADADICIYIINKEALAEAMRKGEAVAGLLHDPSKQTIILTNPDTLFTILALRYREHLNVVHALNKFKAIVIDEFHLYYGVQLANLLFMLKFAEALAPMAFQRKIFLSATPNPDIEALLQDLFQVDHPGAAAQYAVSDSYPALNSVELFLHCQTDEIDIPAIVEMIGEVKDQILACREKYQGDRYVPCVVILNSVVDAIHLEDAISSRYPEFKIAPQRGLMSKLERKLEGAHLVIGTSAIEVGIDFQCSHLIFEAGDASSFLQRFGRIGRHPVDEIPIAHAFVPKNFFDYLREQNVTFLTRDELEAAVAQCYPTYSSYASFVWSDYGLVQAHFFAKRLESLLERWGEVPGKAREVIDSYLSELYNLFKVDEQRQQRIERRLIRSKWFKAYTQTASFRNTIPNVLVYDKREEARGRIPFYETEVSTALAKGTPCIPLPNAKDVFYAVMQKYSANDSKITYPEDLPLVLIDNYDYRYLLTFQTVRQHEPYALFLCSKDDLIASRKQENYGFALLFENHVAMLISAGHYFLTDWRIKKFRTEDPSKYMVFDGDALLYCSLFKPEALEYLLTIKGEQKDVIIM